MKFIIFIKKHKVYLVISTSLVSGTLGVKGKVQGATVMWGGRGHGKVDTLLSGVRRFFSWEMTSGLIWRLIRK